MNRLLFFLAKQSENICLSKKFLSTQPKITTHFTIHPRENDPRWKEIDMERVVDETDVNYPNNYLLFSN